MYKLRIPPDKKTYTRKPGNTVVSSKLAGGLSRQRADVLGASNEVTVTWTVDTFGYEYLCAFFNTATTHGALPFTADLILDTVVLAEYTCYFVPDTFMLSEHLGATYIVTATLEVEPIVDNYIRDYSILLMYGVANTEDSMNLYLNTLEHLVNVDLDGSEI
jgi:hypothetical protein